MAINDVYQLRVVCYTATQVAINTTWWKCISFNGLGATVAAFASAFDTALAPLYKALMSPSAKYRGVSLLNTTIIPAQLSIVTANDGVGAVGADNLPCQTSGLITWMVPGNKKNCRGRIYPGFPSTSWSDTNGFAVAGFATALSALAVQYMTVNTAGAGPNTASLQLCLRQTFAPIPPLTLKTHAVPLVTGYSSPNRFATQRRRGQYGRTNVLPF